MGRYQEVQLWNKISARWLSVTTESRLLNCELLGSIRMHIITAIYSKVISKSILNRPCVSVQVGGIFYN